MAVRFEYEGDSYEFDPNRMSVLEGIELKKVTGYTFIEWVSELEKFDAEAFRYLLWLTLSRAGKRPSGRYSEFDFDMPSVMATFAVDEEPEADPTPPRKVGASKKKSNPTAR